MTNGTAAPPPQVDHGMRNTVLAIGGIIAVIALLAVLVQLGQGPAVDASTSSTGGATPRSMTHTVSYEADGDGTDSGHYTLRSPDGGTRQMSGAMLPLTNKAGGAGLQMDGFRSGDFVYLSIQNENGYGSVTCRIVVDGQIISENTSSGGYTIASCQGRVP
jgi:hypothetical protein